MHCDGARTENPFAALPYPVMYAIADLVTRADPFASRAHASLTCRLFACAFARCPSGVELRLPSLATWKRRHIRTVFARLHRIVTADASAPIAYRLHYTRVPGAGVRRLSMETHGEFLHVRGYACALGESVLAVEINIARDLDSVTVDNYARWTRAVYALVSGFAMPDFTYRWSEDSCEDTCVLLDATGAADGAVQYVSGMSRRCRRLASR